MKPLASVEAADVRGLKGLLFDLDDTLLSHGVLTKVAYDAMWRLHESGMRLVAVTGRPGGWAEVLVRQWPIDGVVAETGAVHVVRQARGVAVTFDGTEREAKERRERLGALVERVAEAMPHVRLSDDHRARYTDVAWDIGERVQLSRAELAQLATFVANSGARMTQSSVHLHATYERDDKASGVVRFLRDRFEQDAGAALHSWAFIGDSGNDAACFAAFSKTFGVANVRAHTHAMSVTPRWVAEASLGAGFAEVADALIALRG
jgi:HAD superfamily hydrolase (TIGR01484 family)